MSANDDNGIDIPSMFVGESTGRIIIYNYQFNEGFLLVLNGELPFNINTHLILPFSIVVGLCFVIMIGFMIMKCVREQRRLRRHRLPGSVLKKIPIIRFAKEHHVALYEICAICLDDYEDGDRLRVLPCAHGNYKRDEFRSMLWLIYKFVFVRTSISLKVYRPVVDEKSSRVSDMQTKSICER